jgi:predicted phage terminase large subunit-like protein
MPATYRYKVHDQGPALWPDHKSLAEVLELKATTPDYIWKSIYQGNPTAAAGTIFHREWWRTKNRYDASDHRKVFGCIGRWLSWDTGLKDTSNSAYTACIVGELWPNYTLAIREVYRERLEFPELPDVIRQINQRYAWDKKTRQVIIEDKASGISAYQTLMAGADKELAGVLVAFNPTTDKITRANQAAVWCRNDCVLLPHPSDSVPWLNDFELELFNAPGSTYMDQVDAFSQLIIWVENYLAQGWHARGGANASVG